MSAVAGAWVWRPFFALLSLNFLFTVGALLAGDYDHIGLPPEMMPMEIAGNGLEALLWLLVAALAFTRNPRFAPELAVFLGGFLWFDVLTTHPLPMPVPAGFLWWGSATCVLMVMGGRWLATRRDHADAALDARDEARTQRQSSRQQSVPRRDTISAPSGNVLVALCMLFALAFALTVVSLAKGDYDAIGLPALVLPWHCVGNAVEGALWLLAALLAWRGSSRAAGWVALFAAGMFAWDMLTTAYLASMPIPYQPWWAPVVVALMLAVSRSLRFPVQEHS